MALCTLSAHGYLVVLFLVARFAERNDIQFVSAPIPARMMILARRFSAGATLQRFCGRNPSHFHCIPECGISESFLLRSDELDDPSKNRLFYFPSGTQAVKDGAAHNSANLGPFWKSEPQPAARDQLIVSSISVLLRRSCPPYVAGLIVSISVRMAIKGMPPRGTKADVCKKVFKSAFSQPAVEKLDTATAIIVVIPGFWIAAPISGLHESLVLRANCASSRMPMSDFCGANILSPRASATRLPSVARATEETSASNFFSDAAVALAPPEHRGFTTSRKCLYDKHSKTSAS